MRPILTLLLLCLFQTFSFAQKARKNISGNYTSSAGMTLSLPWANVFFYHDYETSKLSSKAGFAGLGLSFYYKTVKNKWSLNMGGIADLPAPIGPMDFGKTGSRSATSALFVETNFHRAIYKRLWGIGGVNFVNYRYYFIDYDNDINYTRHDPTVGLTAGLEYVSKKSFAMAFFYRPALVRFKTKQYWHVLSFDARFDLPVWRK